MAKVPPKSTNVKVFCATCGKPKFVRKSVFKLRTNFFCDLTCLGKFNSIEPKPCIQCGKLTKNKKFCNVKCKNKYDSIHFKGKGNPSAKPTKKVKCEYCKNTFEVTLSSKQRFCCRKCVTDNSILIAEELYYGPDWNKIKKYIRSRDKNTCQDCGKVWGKGQKQFDVHHIVPLRKFNGDHSKANKSSNLKLLCKKCHMKLPMDQR